MTLEWLDHPRLVDSERQRVESLKAQCGVIYERVRSTHTGPQSRDIDAEIDAAVRRMGEFSAWEDFYKTAYAFLILARGIEVRDHGAPSDLKTWLTNVQLSPQLLENSYRDVVAAADDLMVNSGTFRGVWLTNARRARRQWQKGNPSERPRGDYVPQAPVPLAAPLVDAGADAVDNTEPPPAKDAELASDPTRPLSPD